MTNMTPEQAYAAFLHEAIMEDGMVIREEQDALLEHLDTQGHITTPANALLGQVKRLASELGPDLLKIAGKALPETMRAMTLQAVAKMVASDQDIGHSEAHFLHRACACLGMDEAEANKLLDQ